MEARYVPLVACFFLVCSTSQAATYRSGNFVVNAPSDEVAKKVGDAAEFYRDELAVLWLGEKLPRWYRPCPINVKVGQIGAGGATTFTFEGGEVFGWRMNVQGSLERILDSVIPHEVCHTIFACHFRCPLPRWADEGAATLVEHESERMRQTRLLDQVIHTNRRIPLKSLLAIKEYPQDAQQVFTLYAEGYSLADYLVQQKGQRGRTVYLAFLKDALERDWSYAFKKHYGYENLDVAEKQWHGWILAGSPQLSTADGVMLADANGDQLETADTAIRVAAVENPPSPVVRGQSPNPLPRINRELRTRPRGDSLSAPEPNTTAMPSRDFNFPAEIAQEELARPNSLPQVGATIDSPQDSGFPARRGAAAGLALDRRFSGYLSP